MARNYSLEAKLNQAADFIKIGGFSGILLSSFLLLSPAKSVGYIGVGAGVSAVGVSVLTKNRYVKAIENHISELKNAKDSEVKEKDEQIYGFTAEIKKLEYQVKTLTKEKGLQQDEKKQLGIELEKAQEQIDNLSNQSDDFKKEWEKSTRQLEDSVKIALQAIIESLEEWQEKISSLASKKTDHWKLTERLSQLLEDGELLLDGYQSKLNEAKAKGNLGELLSIYFCLNDGMVNVKTKMINSINVLSVQEKELSLDESYGSYQTLKDKFINLQKQYNETVKQANAELINQAKNFESRLQEFTVTAENEVNRTWGENEEFFNRLKEAIQSLENVVQELEGKVALLSKPLEYRPAIRADMKIANVIIRYLHALGLILDRSHSDFRGHEATLWFFVDRNQRTPLASELNEHSERLQQLGHTLNNPQFELDPESGLIKCNVQWARKSIVTEDKIQKLFTPLEKITGDVIKRMADDKPTVRIMGATGDGKGVAARYLINAILTLHQWYTRLHDPQDGSAEDHWSIPKVSRSGKELKASLKAINAQLLQRESEKKWDVVTLDVLDEIDTHLEKSDKESFIELCSRVRHCGMKLILIGQNPKVGRAGFQWADMEQMTCLYMGSAVGNAINSSGCSLYQRREKLNKEHQQIMEYLESLNDGEKYLYGLVVIPGKSPKWILLPSPEDVEIDCDELLLGKTFLISNSLREFIDGKNIAKSRGNSAITNSILIPVAKAETLVNQRLAEFTDGAEYVGVAATDGKAANSAKATCKYHVEAELRAYKDGRYYCPSCQKKLAKSDVDYR